MSNVDTPGASTHSMLIASDSFEELSKTVEQLESNNISQESSAVPFVRQESTGSITEIQLEGEECPISTTYGSSSPNQNMKDKRNLCTAAAAAVDGVSRFASAAVAAVSETAGGNSNDSADNIEFLDKEGSRERSPTHSQHEEEMQSERWRNHEKHIFVLSDAGKPIYSRYGNEEKLVTLMGVMQALVSIVQDNQDSIRYIISGQHKFVFLIRKPIILVGVSRLKESTSQFLLQLNYVYNQIISVLTSAQLKKIFEQRKNYDLRNLLSGAEKFIDNLIYMMDQDPSTLLGAVRCLPLASSVRDTVGQIIAQNAKVKDLVFAILIAKGQLITLVRMKRYSIHPSDLHLIFNLVTASTSFQAAESWAPVCLPKFDSSGYLYAHVSYLDDDCSVCLLMLTVNREQFFTLSQSKQKIVEKLRRQNCLQAIAQSLANETYKMNQIGIADLRHFIYKSKSTAQYTSPELEAPYKSVEERQRLFGLYQYLHNRIHSVARPLKILYHMGSKETLLGWMTPGFELYATFGPLVSKPAAISAINKLLRWIKKEEDRLFILNSPTF